jgi:hypothetical protein
MAAVRRLAQNCGSWLLFGRIFQVLVGTSAAADEDFHGFFSRNATQVEVLILRNVLDFA